MHEWSFSSIQVFALAGRNQASFGWIYGHDDGTNARMSCMHAKIGMGVSGKSSGDHNTISVVLPRPAQCTIHA
jgi:hypothetical protein